MRLVSSVLTLSVTLSVLIVFGFAGCHRKDNRVAEETLGVAERVGFHYLEKLNAAESGDGQALAALFRFSQHVDAASALGHGVILIELAAHLGDERFAVCAAAESAEIRQLLRRLLEAGAAYTTTARLSRPPDQSFPQICAALSDA